MTEEAVKTILHYLSNPLIKDYFPDDVQEAMFFLERALKDIEIKEDTKDLFYGTKCTKA